MKKLFLNILLFMLKFWLKVFKLLFNTCHKILGIPKLRIIKTFLQKRRKKKSFSNNESN